MKILSRFLIALSVLLGSSLAPAQTPAPAPAAPVADAPTAPTAAPQPIDPVKIAEIRKLLEVTGTLKMFDQNLSQIIAAFRAQNASVPPEFWDRFQKEDNTRDLVEKMLPLYDKYYTLDDLKALNTFYQSPAGQRMVAATPQIMHESMPIGQEWVTGLGAKVQQELTDQQSKAAAATPAPTPAPSTAAPSAPAPTTPSPAPATP